MTLRFLVLLLGLSAAIAACATGVEQREERRSRSIQLNETVRLGHLQATPTALLEDSRCPSGVQCIQAGTVRVEARIADRGGVRTETLRLGAPIALRGGWVTLVQACPYPAQGLQIRPADYRFILVLTTAGASPSFDLAECKAR